MNICLLLLLGLLFLSSILGQLLEDDTQTRYSRSVANMDELLKVEEELSNNLEHFIAELINKHNTILSGIRMMQERYLLETQEERQEFWENPLNSYSLIRHMQADWHMWQLYMEKPVGLEQLAYLDRMKPKMPQYSDFFDAAEGLRRMQWTYSLLAEDISQGLLDGVQYNSSLTALDCFALAEHLINGSRWTNARKWIQAGLLALERPEPQTAIQGLIGISPALLYWTLARAHLKEGGYKTVQFLNVKTTRKVEPALTAYQIAVNYSPQDAELWQEFYNLERRDLTLPGNYTERPEQLDLDEGTRLPPCCTGGCELPSELQLYCLWNTETHPFLRLAPIKTELLSLNPYVALLHDVVSAAERAHLRSISKRYLRPSGTVDVYDNSTETGQCRTSKSVWYKANFTNATQRLTVLLEDATGLDMRHSEPFQVINYGVGGLFETHVDFLLENENRYNGTADRLTTTLFYLSEVSQGGATVFPNINLTVFPQPGAALFWYNMDATGYENKLSMHAGCPVIVGSKWVMSKWINDLGQELRVRCPSL